MRRQTPKLSNAIGTAPTPKNGPAMLALRSSCTNLTRSDKVIPEHFRFSPVALNGHGKPLSSLSIVIRFWPRCDVSPVRNSVVIRGEANSFCWL